MTEFDDSNIIHPTAIIGPDVKMGFGNQIGPGVIIAGRVILGNRNRIRAYAVIGTPAEKHGHMEACGEQGVIIGSENHISEFVTIHAGTEKPTQISGQCTILAKAHIGHDSFIGPGVTISCAVLVGGHSFVGQEANLGLGAILHQFSVIGAWSMVGMGSVVKRKQKIMPGCTYVGVPARFVRNNTVGLQRAGVQQEALQQSIQAYHARTKDWPDAE